MKATARTPEETYGVALERAVDALARLEPRDAALRAAVTYARRGETGVFEVPLFGSLLTVDWPAGTVRRRQDGTEVDVASRLLVLHYLATTDGTPLAGKWIAFRNLPGGLGYQPAFEGRASRRLVRRFGTGVEAFESAAQRAGGERLGFGDASFVFRALPLVWLAAVLHAADDEFPASASVLFDGAASHHLPTEDLAVLGGMLAGRLIKAAPAP